jgi:hypothetical protein
LTIKYIEIKIVSLCRENGKTFGIHGTFRTNNNSATMDKREDIIDKVKVYNNNLMMNI